MVSEMGNQIPRKICLVFIGVGDYAWEAAGQYMALFAIPATPFPATWLVLTPPATGDVLARRSSRMSSPSARELA